MKQTHGFPLNEVLFSHLSKQRKGEMSSLQQSCLIMDLALALRAHGSWAGETHVQKAGYFLDRLLGVPTELRFILYKHGPFSFDLRELLTDMEANGFIRWLPQPPYGPSIEKGKLSDVLHGKFAQLSLEYSNHIEFVASNLGSRNVANLERIATALYVDSEGYLGASRVAKIVELKPHVDVGLAEQAVDDFDALRDQARRQNLLPIDV